MEAVAIAKKVNGKRVINEWEIESFSSNRKYKVCLLEDNTYTCSCPVWIYKRKECKHIQETKNK